MNFIENKLNVNKNKELFEFITFWIYYKKIDLEKCLINLTENKLKYVINEFFTKNPEYRKEHTGLITINKIKTSEYNFINDNLYVNYFNNFIIGDDNNLLRVYNNNYKSLPFSIFIPFIKKFLNLK